MTRLFAVIATLLAALGMSAPASAHCDTTRGPVVTAARAALDARDPNLVLHWVRAEDEAAVKAAFRHAVQVRALGPEARALADRYFFETLVRIHRAGEGAPYTGLTDDEPEPIIVATDKALQGGSADELERHLAGTLKVGLAERFAAARAARDFRPGDVAAGRAYVAAYVSLTHWVEGVFTAAKNTGEQHGEAASHGVIAHSAGSEPPDHASTSTTATHEGGGARRLPWLLTGIFAVAALVEAALLVRRRRHAAA